VFNVMPPVLVRQVGWYASKPRRDHTQLDLVWGNSVVRSGNGVAGKTATHPVAADFDPEGPHQTDPLQRGLLSIDGSRAPSPQRRWNRSTRDLCGAGQYAVVAICSWLFCSKFCCVL